MRTLGPERLFGGEAGVRLEATRNVVDPLDLVRQRRQEPGRERHHRHQPPAAPEPRAHAHSRMAERRRDSRLDSTCASAGRLSVQQRQGHRVRRPNPRCDFDLGPVSAAGAEASRLGQRGVLESALSDASPSTGMFFGRQFDDDLNRVSNRARPSPACRRTASWTSAPRVTSAEISRCSSACRTCSTRSTTSSSLPTTIGIAAFGQRWRPCALVGSITIECPHAHRPRVSTHARQASRWRSLAR